MKLYLMRHGQAASPQADPEQGLTVEGRIEIEQLAKRLADKGVCFSQVFHSDKARARQTAAIMAAHIPTKSAPQLCSGLKPNDDPRPLIAMINSWPSDSLIVSHLPFVPTLISLLSSEAAGISMIPGTIACMSRTDDIWRLEWMDSP